MKFFNQLGTHVDDLWRKQNYDERAFSAIATRALEELVPSENVTSYDVVRWALRERQACPPLNDESFGEPPVVVFRGRRFYIEVLFWVDGTTSIHQHSFSGAFHVLDGSSIHSQFSFDLVERINNRIRIGEIGAKGLEYLRRGETRPIEVGEAYIHSLFHLERPSVTVVVRTYGEGGGPQFAYFRPGVSFDPFFRDVQLEKQLKLLQMLLKTQPKKVLPAAREVLARTDYWGALKVAQTAYNALEEEPQKKAFAALLEEQHGAARAAHLVAAMDELDHRDRIITLRRSMVSSEHRFFLALLLNLSSRSEMFKMIAARYAGQKPRDVIARWMNEITSQDGDAPLPVPFGSGTLEVFFGLLDGQQPISVAESVAKSGATPKEAKQLHTTVVELCDIFSHSMFRDLLFAA